MAETISIGPDRELELLEFEYDINSLLEVDDLIDRSIDSMAEYSKAKDPLGMFWNVLETECVSACCGIDAFGLWPEDINTAVKKIDREGLLEQLELLRNRVINSDKEIVAYHRINYSFAKPSFLILLDYLITEVEKQS